MNGEMASVAAGKEMARASYIRIKHEEERRGPEGRVFSATRAPMSPHVDQILAGRASFADLAAQHSGCSFARRGSNLGMPPLAPPTRLAGFHIGSPIMANRKHQPTKSSTA